MAEIINKSDLEKNFRRLLEDLSKLPVDFKLLLYQCSGTIKQSRLEKIKTLSHLFETLIETDNFDSEDVGFLKTVYGNLQNSTAVELLQNYERKNLKIPKQNSDIAVKEKSKTFVEVVPSKNDVTPFTDPSRDVLACVRHVSMKITTNWQTLARFLDIPEEVIEENNMNNPRNIREAIRQTFAWWSRNGQSVTKETLVAALRNVRRNDLADELEMNLYG